MIDEQAESFMSARAGGLGGTDLAAIVGLSPWKRPIEIYEGKVNPDGFPELDKEILFWGSALEPIIRERYAIRFDAKVIPPAEIGTMFPRSRPWKGQTIIVGAEDWMLGTPDGILPEQQCGLEIKCSGYKSAEWGTANTDEIPQHYLVQAAWYLAVTGLKAWNFAVLFSGNNLVSYRLERNEELLKSLVEAGRAFWFDNVMARIPPAIDESEAYGRYLSRRFSIGNGNLIPCTPEIGEHALRLKMAQELKKSAENAEQLEKNCLAALIGDADGSKTELGKVAWVRSKNQSYRIDYQTAYTELSAYAQTHIPGASTEVERILKTCTTPTERTAYLRAWFQKEK